MALLRAGNCLPASRTLPLGCLASRACVPPTAAPPPRFTPLPAVQVRLFGAGVAAAAAGGQPGSHPGGAAGGGGGGVFAGTGWVTQAQQAQKAQKAQQPTAWLPPCCPPLPAALVLALCASQLLEEQAHATLTPPAHLPFFTSHLAPARRWLPCRPPPPPPPPRAAAPSLQRTGASLRQPWSPPSSACMPGCGRAWT